MDDDYNFKLCEKLHEQNDKEHKTIFEKIERLYWFVLTGVLTAFLNLLITYYKKG